MSVIYSVEPNASVVREFQAAIDKGYRLTKQRKRMYHLAMYGGRISQREHRQIMLTWHDPRMAVPGLVPKSRKKSKSAEGILKTKAASQKSDSDSSEQDGGPAGQDFGGAPPLDEDSGAPPLDEDSEKLMAYRTSAMKLAIHFKFFDGQCVALPSAVRFQRGYLIADA
jgi:hypothetical protein